MTATKKFYITVNAESAVDGHFSSLEDAKNNCGSGAEIYECTGNWTVSNVLRFRKVPITEIIDTE